MQLIEKYAVKNNVVVNRKTASGNFFPKYESALSKDQLLSLIGTKKKESCEEKTASGRCVYANGDPINFVDPTGRSLSDMQEGDPIGKNAAMIQAEIGRWNEGLQKIAQQNQQIAAQIASAWPETPISKQCHKISAFSRSVCN